MKTSEFDKRFDEGNDISEYLDVSKNRRPNQKQKGVNIDFPARIIHLLDKESRRLGVTRQCLVKVWVAEHFKSGSQIATNEGCK